MDSLPIFCFPVRGSSSIMKTVCPFDTFLSLKVTVGAHRLGRSISLCLWRHPQAALRIACSRFLASYLSRNQFISSSQKWFRKQENINTIVICHTLASIKKYIWTHMWIHLYGKAKTRGCTRSVAFCLSKFAILVMSVGDIICPTRSLIPIPKHSPSPR